MGEAPVLRKLRREIAELHREREGPKKFKHYWQIIEEKEAHARLLERAAWLRRQLHGRNPTAYHLLAMTALRHGLGSEEVQRENYLMNRLRLRKPGGVTWDGSVPHLLSSVRLPDGQALPEAVETLLFEEPGAWNGRQVAERLGLPWDEKRQNALNAAFQLLDAAGIVRKMPYQKPDKGGLLAVWSHAAHLNPAVNYPNLSMMLLQRLYEEDAFAKELYSHGSVSASISNVLDGLKSLEKMGLVALEKTRSATTSSSKRGGTIPVERIKARLTHEGRTLMEHYQKTNSLPEKLRRLLLETA